MPAEVPGHPPLVRYGHEENYGLGEVLAQAARWGI
jgi:hypothetical protein